MDDEIRDNEEMKMDNVESNDDTTKVLTLRQSTTMLRQRHRLQPNIPITSR